MQEKATDWHSKLSVKLDLLSHQLGHTGEIPERLIQLFYPKVHVPSPPKISECPQPIFQPLHCILGLIHHSLTEIFLSPSDIWQGLNDRVCYPTSTTSTQTLPTLILSVSIAEGICLDYLQPKPKVAGTLRSNQQQSLHPR